MSGRPGVVAHRGSSGEVPEHTLAAYEQAVADGADALECDVRLTRDGHLVCVHDRRVDRTSTGRGPVSAMTLDELAELDYGSWRNPLPADAAAPLPHDDHGGVPISTGRRHAGGPARLLTLTALLDLTTAHPDTTLFIETKHPVRYGGLVESKVVAELHRFGLAAPAEPAAARAVVMSFSATAVRRLYRTAPSVPTVLLGGTTTGLSSLAVNAVRADYVGPSIDVLRERPEFVRRFGAGGVGTYTWTVDERTDVETCRDLGVDWIATNHPRQVRAWLRGVDG